MILDFEESDRLAAMAAALTAVGAQAAEHADGLVIDGSGGEPLPGGGPIATHLDHRIAMSMAVAGLASEGEVRVKGAEAISVSFPNFAEILKELE